MAEGRKEVGRLQKSSMISAAMAVALTQGVAHAQDFRISLPVTCEIGSQCYVQNLPDIDPGPGVMDPLCSAAAYDGHSGTDFGVPSMVDVARGVAVVAVADGVVARTRDGIADRIVQTEADRAAVDGVECGNGVLIDHGGGWQTQYCHLREGSIAVDPGDRVARGDVIGAIGSSGFAEFPHVHLSVIRDGVDIDPFTGEPFEGKCLKRGDPSASLWDREALAALPPIMTQFASMGFADGAVDSDALVVSPPGLPLSGSDAMVGWVRAINLARGDQLALRVLAPDGSIFAETTTEPMERPRATQTLFAGRSRPPETGTYVLEVAVIREGLVLVSDQRRHLIE